MPTTLDELVEATGAKSINYPNKKTCCVGCGAFFGGVSDQIAMEMNYATLRNLKEASVDCMVTTCPFCFFQFDMGQLQISEKYGERYEIPVLHYTDLLGLALEIEPRQLDILSHRISPEPMLAKLRPTPV